LEKTKWKKTSPGVEVASAASASEFVNALRRSNPHWWEGSRSPWVFRGHSSAAWSLLPSAWRPNNSVLKACRCEAARRFDTVAPQQSLRWIPRDQNFETWDATFGQNDQLLKRTLAIEATAELLSVWDFVLACNALGVLTPLNKLPPDSADEPNYLFWPERPLVADDLIRFPDLLATLALAQHHGLPTRLLDWTLAPITAAFFAIEEINEPKPGEQIAVWALNRERATSIRTEGISFPGNGDDPTFHPGIAIVRPPVRDNSYLAAQSGLFTTIDNSGIYFMKNEGARPSLEALVEQSGGQETILRKIVLPHDQVPELAEILRREQISRSALMPTLDNIAKDVLTRRQSI
jgi:FRG domain